MKIRPLARFRAGVAEHLKPEDTFMNTYMPIDKQGADETPSDEEEEE